MKAFKRMTVEFHHEVDGKLKPAELDSPTGAGKFSILAWSSFYARWEWSTHES
jgi:hypothetical protein